MRIKLNYLYALVLMLSFSCSKKSSSTPNELRFDDNRIQYEGRVEMKAGDAAYLYWPGTMARVRFSGTGISVTMQDDSINGEGDNNYFYIIVDGVVQNKKLKIEKDKRSYTLAENLSDGEHIVELFKLNAMYPVSPIGYAKLYKFRLVGDGDFLDPPALKNRKMEFYGNSITCGFSNEVEEGKGDNGNSKYENNYLAYGAITARHFHARYRCISKSGIGFTTNPSMPELYDLLNPFDLKSKWRKFSQYVPDIVVINLFQNDAARILNNSVTKEDAIKQYQHFILNIRRHYLEAHIICTLGSMDAVESPELRQIIIDAVNGLDDNSRVYTLFFPYMEKTGHPRIADHQEMAVRLIDFIERNIGW